MCLDAPSAVLAATGNDHFVLIFIDVSAPGGGGDAAARLIRATVGPNMAVPLIATAGVDRSFLLPSCFDDVLHKPFSRDEVLRKLEQLIAAEAPPALYDPANAATATADSQLAP